MSPERWRRIEKVYQAACDRAPADRGAYLAETCGEDRDLRNEVESLLRRDDSASNGQLNRPAWVDFGSLDDTLTRPAPGMRLGPYEIEDTLGAGGMGEVFRARDTRLNRRVAVKILHARFSDRFEREARAISALNHPNICTLYDVGPNFLVMEFLEGETLASRLKKGPLPFTLACQYGAQIGNALAAAHGKGLVHRDLKPANIMLTKGGIKVLDFGLAKRCDDETLTQGILGTPAYMSPEQKAGAICDHRTDIYALGLVLREMVAGTRVNPTRGAEPQQFTQLVDRCLRDDPDERWQSASDLANVLEWLRVQPSPLPEQKRRPARTRWVVAAALLLLLAVIAALWKQSTHRVAPPSVVRLALEIPSEGLASDPGQLSGPPAISPDGKVIVLTLAANGSSSLWIRRLDSDRFERMEGTQGAQQPFWSPDGAQIGFFAEGKLKKMKMPHGPPEILCDTPTDTARGGSWSSKGVILFGVNLKGMMKIPETGGDPLLVAGLDATITENSIRFPQFLADGNHFIYFSRTSNPLHHGVYLDALDTLGKIPRRKLTVADGPSALGHDPFSRHDFLVFPKDGHLWAQRFDAASGSLAGEKLAISDDVGQYSLSATATLVFRHATSEQSTLVWLDRAGKSLGQVGQPGEYWDVALSPDEHYAATLNHRSREGRFWVDMIDLSRNLQSAFSDSAGRASGLVWSRDSGSLYFTLYSGKQSQIVVRRVNAAAPPQIVNASPERYDVRSLNPDGTFAADHWIGTAEHGLGFAVDGRLPWRVFEYAPAAFKRVQFSPDGKWLLYQSNESGAWEIYLSDYPGLTLRRRVSVAGGMEPRWGRDGKEIFYVVPGRVLTTMPIHDQARMIFGDPRALFRLPAQLQPGGGFSYDATRDTQRFLVLNTTPPANARDLSVIFNWPQLMGSL
jgi:Tol biopolymer transport system component